MVVDFGRGCGCSVRSYADELVCLLARPSTSVRFALGGHLAIVLRSELSCGGAPAFTSKNSSRTRAGILQKIIGQGECGAKVLTATRRPVLR